MTQDPADVPQDDAIDYLALLQQGVPHWNHWRATHPHRRPDLSRAYLLEADLREANLQQVDLSRACLIDADLKAADLSGANLRGIYGDRANFSHANLRQADLSEANLHQAILSQSNLSQVTAWQTKFVAATLTGACIQQWHIDQTTDFAEVICEYLYRRSPQAERYPSHTSFTPTTFNRFISQCYPSAPRASAAVTNAAVTNAAVTNAAITNASKTRLPFQRWPLLMAGGLLGLGLVSFGIGLALNLGSGPQSLSAGGTVSTENAAAKNADDETAKSQPHQVDLTTLPCSPAPQPAIRDQPPSYRYSSGAAYYGQHIDGTPVDGPGVMIFANGDRYDGNFQNGMRHGCGTFTLADGQQYVGQFEADQLSGVGRWQFTNGDRYVGQFRHNQCDGWGTYVFAAGSSRTGLWRQDGLVGDRLSCKQPPEKDVGIE